MPMLRAFQVILDYKQDKVGFADKVHNLGAAIFGDNAPSQKSKADEPRDNPDKPEPVLPDDKPTDKPADKPTD